MTATRFFSDNAATVHPAVMEAMAAANQVDTAYDGDALSQSLDAAFSELFETECEVVWIPTGTVRLKLYKGNASVVGRKSPFSLYSERHVTFEDDAGAYDQKDAAGFIKLNALRVKLLAKQGG